MRHVIWCLLVLSNLPPTGIARGQATADALAARGDSALDRGDPAAALAAFDAALRQRPSDAALLQRRGRALREQGKLDDALAAYDRAVAADSGSTHRVGSPPRLACPRLVGQSARAPSTAASTRALVSWS